MKIELHNQRKKLTELETEYGVLYEERERIDWIKKYSKQLKINASKKDADLRNWIKGLVKNVVVHTHCGEDRIGKLAHIGLSDSWLIIIVSVIYLLGVQGITIEIHLPLNNYIQNMNIDKVTDTALAEERRKFEKNGIIIITFV